MELNGTHQLPVNANGVNLLDRNINTININREALLKARKETGGKCRENKEYIYILSPECRTK
jgi:hypothetical protein